MLHYFAVGIAILLLLVAVMCLVSFLIEIVEALGKRVLVVIVMLPVAVIFLGWAANKLFGL